mmetsp:Transcript_70497/g.198863  ORF Transcript_70497/g.198863 Transcript_70497/m.198863 type:complete len:98 (+) Transcript_70497:316-609(+)
MPPTSESNFTSLRYSTLPPQLLSEEEFRMSWYLRSILLPCSCSYAGLAVCNMVQKVEKRASLSAQRLGCLTHRPFPERCFLCHRFTRVVTSQLDERK